MTFPVLPHSAPTAKMLSISRVAFLLAVLLSAMVIAQLFHYEKFIPLVETYNLPGGIFAAHLFAAIIVVLEVAALPFLLRMRLSHAMRFISMVSGWLVVILWLFVQFYLNLYRPTGDSNGLFGTVFDMGVGWLSILFVVFLGCLTAWVSWNMSPFAKKK